MKKKRENVLTLGIVLKPICSASIRQLRMAVTARLSFSQGLAT